MNNYPKFPVKTNTAHPHHTCSYLYTQSYSKGITPKMLKSAYSFTPVQNTASTSIAVISAFDNPEIIDSMKCFCETFSLNVPEMELHYPLGKSAVASRRWVTESCLDTQWAHVFSPFSKIHTVLSIDDDINNLLECAVFASNELKADIICMCFGLKEITGFSKYIDTFVNISGIFVASSGDTGGIPSFPSTLPFCVSVGGTKLDFTKDKTRMSEETAWGSGGGGSSILFDIPCFQEIFVPINQMSQSKRAIPDLSFFAYGKENCAVCTNGSGSFTTVGGTSLSCACMSGILSLIKTQLPNLNTSTKMLSYLYSKAGLTKYTSPQYNFNDIRVGKSGGFFAKDGWDFCTGLGSPVIKQLLI